MNRTCAVDTMGAVLLGFYSGDERRLEGVYFLHFLLFKPPDFQASQPGSLIEGQNVKLCLEVS